MSNKTLAIKRISNDLKEINNCPLEGIGIASIDNDPMKYVVNIKLMMGLYEGYCIQLLMTFPDNYPTKPPKMLIYSGQELDNRYHHHIYNDYNYNLHNEYFKGFCFDFLENKFMSTSEEHSGWNPGYTISSILLQVQQFLSDPDLPKSLLPNQQRIDYLMKSMDKYRRTFTIKEANDTKTIVHTWKEPYPKMHVNYTKMGIDEDDDKAKKDADYKMREIKGNLTCFMLKNNYIDNPDILLGYPIIQNKDVLGKNKIELYPIPELLSFEAFNSQKECQKINELNLYFEMNFKAANNEFYNFWLPIYINREHYEKNKLTIIESLKVIKKENEFKPEQIFEILPIILNKMIIGMFSGKSFISCAFIQCYFQYVLLFKKLIQEYEAEFIQYATKKIDLITKNDYEVNKNIIPDIGNFLMLMFYTNKELMNAEEKKKIWYVLSEELFIRQMYWMFHGDECKNKMKKLIIKNNINEAKLLDKIYLDKFETDPDFKMRYLDIFNKEIHKLGIYDQIIDILSGDQNILWQYYDDANYAKSMVIKRITQSFKKLFNECYKENRDKLKEIILEKMNFSIFFERELNEMKEDIYNSMEIDEILKNKNIQNQQEILEYAFSSQRGNQLLLITFFAQKKIEEKDFLENLEKNYGVYLGIDGFLKDMKEKLKEIKSFKELYKYIGSDYAQDKDGFELLIEGYKRAKEKGYIKDKKKENIRNNGYGNGIQRRGYRNQYRNEYGYQRNKYRNDQMRGNYSYGYGNNIMSGIQFGRGY